MGALASRGLGQVAGWQLRRPVGPSTWLADDGGSPIFVRVAPEGSPAAVEVEAEAAALDALGPLGLPGLVRGAGTRREGALVAVATHAVDGAALAAVPPAPWPGVAPVLTPVADALAALHARGWVHGDVSATNIVVAGGAAVLVDLACARPVAAARPTGTPGTAAPEVEAGSPVTPAAEMWALAAVAAAATSGPPPGELRAALAADPGRRPSMADLAAALRAATAPDPRAATTRDFGPRPPAPPAAAPVPRRRAGPVLVAAAAVAAAVTALAWSGGAAPTRCPPVGDGALVGDPDGDGCPTAGTWAGGILSIVLAPGEPVASVAVGAPGDVVALGDWDCDGVDTPAAYRPATGDLTVWDRWPTAGVVEPAEVRGEQAGAGLAVERGGRCDRVEVAPRR